MDIFRDEGMTRFSVPVGMVEDKVNELWEGFLTSHQQDDRHDHFLKVELTKLIYDGCLKNPQKIDYDKILIAITILYAFRRNEIIIKIVERLNFSYDNRYQIALIYAASMYKSAKHPGVIEKIDKILLDLENCSAFDKNYKFWIGMGYVKFNVWKTLTTPTKAEHSDPDDFYRRKYLKDGIKLTKRAFNFLADALKTGPDDDHRMVKYYYTLNNYIYYNVESKEPGHILDENFYHEFVTVLQTCQQSDQYRQNRFSDTIARYYLAKALLDKDLDDKHSDLEKAHRYIVDAINYAVLKDERFEDLKSDIEFNQQSVKAKRNNENKRDIRFEQ
ncbi:MAG: hypothetical protein JWR12_3089 [Mucilaginibacter sp.]|nr:hypothetical protein [Mucilaginibacter sp.]